MPSPVMHHQDFELSLELQWKLHASQQNSGCKKQASHLISEKTNEIH